MVYLLIEKSASVIVERIMSNNYGYTCTTDYLIRYQKFGRGYNDKSKENLNKGFRTVGVSKVTSSKIRKHVSVLNLVAKEKEIEGKYNKKYSVKCRFITLTLCSSQIHSDQFITKELLGGFLNLCRKEGVLRNYVWRAEKQKRGNIHYHIITDCNVSERLVYKFWVRQLEKYGYLKEYQNKFRNMTFREYEYSQKSTGASRERLLYRYNKGKKLDWSKPNSTDIKNVEGDKGIEKYLSKYLSKSNNSDNIVRGRVWGCSSGVSLAANTLYKDYEFNKMCFEHGVEVLRKEVLVFDFCEVCKCSLNSLFMWFGFLKDYIFEKLLRVITPVDVGMQMAIIY